MLANCSHVFLSGLTIVSPLDLFTKHNLQYTFLCFVLIVIHELRHFCVVISCQHYHDNIRKYGLDLRQFSGIRQNVYIDIYFKFAAFWQTHFFRAVYKGALEVSIIEYIDSGLQGHRIPLV